MKTSCPMSAVRVAGLRLALLGFVLAPLAAAEGQVWVLSRGGGFPQLPLDPQPVIDAAADGDVLLFETGVYTSAVVDGKSLTLVSDTGASVLLRTLTVQHLAADQSVTVSGVPVTGMPFSLPSVVTLRDNAGTVHLEHCTLGAEASGFNLGQPQATVTVEQCAGVDFTDCTLIARYVQILDGSFNGLTAPALHVQNGRVSLHATQASGTQGFPGSDNGVQLLFPTTGSVAIELLDATLVASGCAVSGGSGGKAAELSSGGCFVGAAGAPAVTVSGDAHIVLHDTQVVGGPGGSASGSCPGGPGAVPFQPAVADVTQWPGTPPALSITPVAREARRSWSRSRARRAAARCCCWATRRRGSSCAPSTACC